MRDALATLPWVETDSIQPSREKRQVKFTVKDKAKFDFEAVKKALADKGYDSGAKILTGPTEQ
ncbi:MAG TPA: hypothetical protein VM597_09580 [Gemmataceae bacterium]|nr:hypothetical protein [Gemmataceae bacterium]